MAMGTTPFDPTNGLQKLSLALRSGAEGKANLAGLNEQYARANALRGSHIAQKDQYGQVSPFAVLADVINRSRGAGEMRDLEAQRAAARKQVAENANAVPLFNAKNSLDAAALNQKKAEQQQAFNAARAAETSRHNMAAEGIMSGNAAETAANNKRVALEKARANAAAEKARQTKNSSIVQLVDPSDPTKTLMVGKRGMQYFDMNTGKQFDPTGYVEKPKTTRGSGSFGELKRSKDAYGNEIFIEYNKNTQTLKPVRFATGEPYDEAVAAKRGKIIAEQAGKETKAKEFAKTAIKQGVGANADVARINESLMQVDKGLKALDDGAQTGPIANSMFKWATVRDSTIALQNAADSLAMSEIGQHTFGSLSEAEAKWLKDVSIPMGMDEDQLRPWLKNKREGLVRLSRVAQYSAKMWDNGFKPDPTVIKDFLYHGGFKFEDAK